MRKFTAIERLPTANNYLLSDKLLSVCACLWFRCRSYVLEKLSATAVTLVLPHLPTPILIAATKQYFTSIYRIRFLHASGSKHSMIYLTLLWYFLHSQHGSFCFYSTFRLKSGKGQFQFWIFGAKRRKITTRQFLDFWNYQLGAPKMSVCSFLLILFFVGDVMNMNYRM